jgi:hypothetical protein
MPSPVHELLESACEDCAIFDKCLLPLIPFVVMGGESMIEMDHQERIEFHEESYGKSICPNFIPKIIPDAPDAIKPTESDCYVEKYLEEIEGWCNAVLTTGTALEQSDEGFKSNTIKFKALKEVIKAYSLDNQSELVTKVQSLLMQVYGGLKNGSVSK